MSAVAEKAAPAGVTLPSSPEGRSGFLADVIVELELADREAVEKATSEARLRGRTLADVLVEKGTLSEHDLARAVAERHGLAMVDLEAFPLDPEAAALVSRMVARRYGVAPAGFAPDGSLLLAMTDPSDSLARNDVAVMTRLEVVPVIASRAQIDAVVEQLAETGVQPVADADEPALAPATGALLWQSDDSGQVQVPAPDLRAEKARTAELELELSTVRTELEELRARSERKRADLEERVRGLRQELGERDTQMASMEGDLAYRDGRLGELERQLADRDSALRELQTELAALRRTQA